MISLKFNDKPYDIELVKGVILTVRPLTTFDMAIARESACERMDRMKNSVDDVEMAGMIPVMAINLDDPIQYTALFHKILISELAERHILEWSGVTDYEGKSVSVDTPGAKSMVVALFPYGEIFYNKFTAQQLELSRAKKDCGVGASGISNPEPAPNIVKDVKTAVMPVPQKSTKLH